MMPELHSKRSDVETYPRPCSNALHVDKNESLQLRSVVLHECLKKSYKCISKWCLITWFCMKGNLAIIAVCSTPVYCSQMGHNRYAERFSKLAFQIIYQGWATSSVNIVLQCCNYFDQLKSWTYGACCRKVSQVNLAFDAMHGPCNALWHARYWGVQRLATSCELAIGSLFSASGYSRAAAEDCLRLGVAGADLRGVVLSALPGAKLRVYLLPFLPSCTQQGAVIQYITGIKA